MIVDFRGVGSVRHLLFDSRAQNALRSSSFSSMRATGGGGHPAVLSLGDRTQLYLERFLNTFLLILRTLGRLSEQHQRLIFDVSSHKQ